MIELDDLDAAVTAGVIDARVRAQLTDFVSRRRMQEAEPDAERFRLLTGFNDIFVALACVALLAAAGSLVPQAPALGAAAVAALAWVLAEYFTRVRRMALPSILLLLAFVGASFVAVFAATAGVTQINDGNVGETSVRIGLLVAAVAGVAAAAAHWWRFRVPITVAAGAAAAVGGLVALAAAWAQLPRDAVLAVTLAGGLGVFALAMHFDMRDRLRVTRWTDVAFWLHLLAAPLIVHPVFALSGLMGQNPAPGSALVILAAYLGLTLVALIVDRRALLVSALAYVIWAIQSLLEAGRGVEASFGLTALLIGGFLVLLSAAWGAIRARVLGALPASLAERMPIYR